MNASIVFKLNRRQYLWVFIAYWRLWWVQVRLKGTGPAWLTKQLHLDEAPERAEPSINNTVTVSQQSCDYAEQMYEAVRLAARCHFWRTACLPKSIVLADMLNAGHGMRGSVAKQAVRTSQPAKVRIGVLRRSGQEQLFASHAWVELNGRMLAEPSSIDQQFKKVIRKS